PALVFQLDVLYGHGIRIGVKVWQRLILRDPAAEDFVGNGRLAGFVVNFEQDVFAKVLQRDFLAQARSELPYLVGPLLELEVVRYPALKSNRIKFGAPWRFPAAARVTALPVFDDLGGAF